MQSAGETGAVRKNDTMPVNYMPPGLEESFDIHGDGLVRREDVDANGNGYLDCSAATSRLSRSEFVKVENSLLMNGLIRHRQKHFCRAQMQYAEYGGYEIEALYGDAVFNQSPAARNFLRNLSVHQVLESQETDYINPETLMRWASVGNEGALRQLARQARSDWRSVKFLHDLAHDGNRAAHAYLKTARVDELIEMARYHKEAPTGDPAEIGGVGRAMSILKTHGNPAVVSAVAKGEVDVYNVGGSVAIFGVLL